MKERIKRTFDRARYAALGAAIGAGLGGLISKNAASTGGATGALVGALIAEKRHSAGGLIEKVKEQRPEPGDSEPNDGVVGQIAEFKEKRSSKSD